MVLVKDPSTNQKREKNENGPEAAEFLGAHPRSDRRNQSLKYRFLMQFQEFEELTEFYQDSIKFTEGTLLELSRFLQAIGPKTLQ